MTRLRKEPFYVLLLMAVKTALATDVNTKTEYLQCDLYLAPSSIPGAGLGIYSGIPKDVGDTVGNGDVCIPFLDIYWHNDNHFFFPMSDYVWDGRVMGMQMEVDDDDINAFWPGLDCA